MKPISNHSYPMFWRTQVFCFKNLKFARALKLLNINPLATNVPIIKKFDYFHVVKSLDFLSQYIHLKRKRLDF